MSSLDLVVLLLSLRLQSCSGDLSFLADFCLPSARINSEKKRKEKGRQSKIKNKNKVMGYYEVAPRYGLGLSSN